MPGNVAIALLSAAAVAAVLPNPRVFTTPYATRPMPGGLSASPEELRNYAEALIEVRRIQTVLAAALAQAPAAAAPTLQGQANYAVGEILRRRSIASARFNQISLQVDRNPAIRRTVRQFVMQERLGI
jgi:hypothetical protein